MKEQESLENNKERGNETITDKEIKKITEEILEDIGITSEYSNSPEVKERLQKTERLLKRLPDDVSNQINTNYSRFFVSEIKDNLDNLELLKKRLEDEVVVDLGAGNTGKVFRLLNNENIEVDSYIFVDKFEEFGIKRWGKDLNKARQENKDAAPDFRIGVEVDDMLRFVSKLPNSSVSFIMCGVDNEIIESNKYWERLFKQIRRSLSDDGLFAGLRFGLHLQPQKNLKTDFFNDITPTQSRAAGSDLNILEKKI